MSELMKYAESADLYSKISNLITAKKYTVSRAVNSAIVFLYWEIGETICKDILQNHKAEYGKNIINEVAKQLSQNYGKGFDRTAIFRMVQFYQEFPDKEKVATLSQQLTWSHFVVLLPIEDELKRDFYAAMCKSENWSVRVLRERKNSMLYERTAISKKPDETIKNDIALLMEKDKMSLDLFYRDPYVLDFLGLKDNYMDLLFYHRSLRRLVLIELKLGAFEPEHKGQVELYLRWLKKNEMCEGEDDPIALILCAEKSQETVELMELDKGSIHVAQYLTKMPPKELLEEKLAIAIENAKEQLEQR